MQIASFYGFRPKTVRSWDGNRMFLVRKPYGFGTENVKGRQPETDYEAFSHALIHILPNKFLPLLPLLQVVGRQHTVFFLETVAVIVAVIEATGKSGTRYIIPLFHHQPYTVT